ncbi:MAG TPA: hypothetical protein PLT55_01025 [Acidimicrobiia bacterium]|nr:hypothetical protein [Acidimicrobiia bacterium]
MQTLNKKSFSNKIKLFIADKPALARGYEMFETEQEEDIAVYAAFTGSKHEIPSRIRRTPVIEQEDVYEKENLKIR